MGSSVSNQVFNMSTQSIRSGIAELENQIRSIRESICVVPSEATFAVQENQQKEAKVMKLRKKIGVMLCAMRACGTTMILQRSTTLPSIKESSEASLSTPRSTETVFRPRIQNRPKLRSRKLAKRAPRSPLGMVCTKLVSL